MELALDFCFTHYDSHRADLFKHQLSENSITEIREATNKAWVLGNDRFKQRIQEQFNSNRVIALGRTTSY